MTSNVLSVNTSNKLADVAELFQENNIHHVPVVSGDNVIGIISKTDMERISFVSEVSEKKVNTAIYDMLSIEQVMTTNVENIQSADPIKDAATIFAQGKFHALPVLNGESIVGIVTTTDLMKHLLDQY